MCSIILYCMPVIFVILISLLIVKSILRSFLKVEPHVHYSLLHLKNSNQNLFKNFRYFNSYSH